MLFALLTAVAGISLSLFARARIAGAEADAARLTADTLRQHTELELQRFADALESTPFIMMFEASNIDQTNINEFVEMGMPMQHAVLGAFGLAQTINQQTRTRTEAQHKINSDQGYLVVHKDRSGNWIPAGHQMLYYPLFFQSRKLALKIPNGFDFSSLRSAYKTIRTAERSWQTMADPTPTFFSPSDNPSYWVFAPFRDPYDPTSATAGGVAVAILRPNELLEKITSFATSSPQLKLTPTVTAQPCVNMANQTWVCKQSLHAIGTDWLFECILPAPAGERRSTAVFAFGITVTALMTVIILILTSRTRQIEAEVLARTEELRIANRQLELNMRERAQLEEEMADLAAREQRRIGRDLHDSLGQKLTGAVLLSRSLLNWFQKEESRTQNPEPRTRNSHPDTRHPILDTQTAHAATLNQTLKDSVSQVRNMARGLASVHLNEENLDESLDQLADEMSALYNIPCTVSHSDTLPELSNKTKEQLYFIAREAVNNAAKHAQPSTITITLSGNDASWSLRIEDDGTGINEHTPNGEGMGLRIMRHRAARIGAEFSIHSTPEKGTIIKIKSAQQP